MSRGIVRIERERGVKLGECGLKVSLAEMRDTELAMTRTFGGAVSARLRARDLRRPREGNEREQRADRGAPRHCLDDEPSRTIRTTMRFKSAVGSSPRSCAFSLLSFASRSAARVLSPFFL